MSAAATAMRRTAWAAVAVAAFLVALKAAAYIATGSVAMMASLADSALDLVASTVNLLAVRTALTPADAEHRFGHGKAEPLAGLLQGAFIAASVLFLVLESTQRLSSPHAIANSGVAFAVMGVSLAVTFGLVVLQRRTVRATGSLAIGADSAHYLGDLLTNLGVIAGIALSTVFGWLIADPLIGLGVAGVLAFSAFHVLRRSYDQLMDREFAEDERGAIKAIVLAHPEVRGIHDLRTRVSGIHAFIQFHIELDPAARLTQAHRICDAVERDVLTRFPNAEVLIHQDPAGAEDLPELART